MCRLAAFPPNFPKKDAYNIMWNFLKGNTDGTGSIHVKDGQFVTRRYPYSLTKVVKEQKVLLGHMPYPGWTVVHVRAASHGDNKVVNTHPFIKGKWGVVHNGVWSEYSIAKAALHRLVDFEGDTDTEVAAYVFSAVGPKKFSKLIDYGGVYLGLHQSGDLWAVKTSGDLVMVETKYGQVLASELPDKYDDREVEEGWVHLGADGKLIRKAENTRRWSSGTSQYSGGYGGYGYGSDSEYAWGNRMDAAASRGDMDKDKDDDEKEEDAKLTEVSSDRDLWDGDERKGLDQTIPCWD
jgi:hypothetical protein